MLKLDWSRKMGVSIRAPVKGAIRRRMLIEEGLTVSIRAPVKGAIVPPRPAWRPLCVSIRAPVKGAMDCRSSC